MIDVGLHVVACAEQYVALAQIYNLAARLKGSLNDFDFKRGVE